ncbi:MAG: hypothetical protein H6590_06025 [Flavobacteriales bacterium]|nr:hypothetical protein [Flavobacteriales bacterium]
MCSTQAIESKYSGGILSDRPEQRLLRSLVIPGGFQGSIEAKKYLYGEPMTIGDRKKIAAEQARQNAARN